MKSGFIQQILYMKKIPSLFIRDFSNKACPATEQVTPGCEWVLAGEGIATRKWDGTAILFMDGLWFKRYDAKHGKIPPPDFFEAQPEPDQITGHWPGWIPVVDDYKADKYIVEAIWNFTCAGQDPAEGQTYEAVGPQINGNRDKWPNHMLKQHGAALVFTKEWQPRTFRTIRNQLDVLKMEGFVYHHPDGRMCKVKRSDFGLPWPIVN